MITSVVRIFITTALLGFAAVLAAEPPPAIAAF
jgi:hypothetical protein